jgi:hypothetical protein
MNGNYGRARALIAASILMIFVSQLQAASTVFSNDFETNTAGFTNGGSLPALTRTSLPTDSAGLSSANQSQWLGRLGAGIAKSGAQDEIVTLNVTGLVPGIPHFVQFDLLIGDSWDGNAGCCGPDKWRFAIDGNRLVDTTFTNGNAGQEYGAVSLQAYSDTTYTNPNVGTFTKFTGADQSFTTGTTNYAQHYAIYYFGHGTSNPILSFVPTSTTATLEFARYGNTTDNAAEYWALDNVRVTNLVPEPASAALLSLTTLGLLLSRRRFVR